MNPPPVFFKHHEQQNHNQNNIITELLKNFLVWFDLALKEIFLMCESVHAIYPHKNCYCHHLEFY
jgi:hypothetical protein